MDAATFAALGEPRRLEIVELLRIRRFPVGDIAERLGMRQPQVSKHLRVLHEAGIVAVEPIGRRRIYGLREEPFEEVRDWVDSFEATWETRLDQLGTFLGRDDDDEGMGSR